MIFQNQMDVIDDEIRNVRRNWLQTEANSDLQQHDDDNTEIRLERPGGTKSPALILPLQHDDDEKGLLTKVLSNYLRINLFFSHKSKWKHRFIGNKTTGNSCCCGNFSLWRVFKRIVNTVILFSHPRPRFIFFFCNNFPVRQHLRAHQKVHKRSLETITKCNQCEKTFADHHLLRRHTLNVHSAKIDIKCPHCPKHFQSKLAISKHLKRHVEAKLQCDICKKMFRLKKNLTIHIQMVHIREPSHVCHLCGSAYVYATRLTKHIRQCENGGNMKPKRCHRTKAEIMKSMPVQNVKCHFCSKSFTSMTAIRKHYAEQHAADGVRVKMICQFCNQLLESMAQKAIHIGANDPELFKCNLCPSKLRCEQRFYRHRMLHAHSGRYLCTVS